jgi:predicted ATP-grasp superfamily ATP-dependent carboligase
LKSDSSLPFRLFVPEFITGGGLAGEPIPQALAAEGDGMLRALLRDLSEIEGMEIVTTRDARLPPLAMGVTETPVQEHPWERWAECIAQAQAVWPIAPETGGVLERLSREVLRQERYLIGSRPEAVAIAASKWTTAECLVKAGVPVVETMRVGEGVPESAAGWVVKPDDGAGCENTFYFGQRGQLESWLGADDRESDIIQPYVAGAAASLSLLCSDGMVRILACNEQLIELRDGQLHLSGIKVNALSRHQAALHPLAERVVQAIPGLWGYAGIDLVLTDAGPVVMEVNPRLTTSYVGLAHVIGQNPAGMVLDLLRKG